jgi:DNA-binding response OmpR family regulator
MASTFAANHSRTLVVDASAAQGGQLSGLLNHAGFKAEFAGSWHGARTSLRANHYNSCIVVADLNQVDDLKQLNELRGVAKSVWIVVLCDLQAQTTLLLARRLGVDAVLPASFSMLDLTSRLAAFSLRSRPIF